LPLLKPSIQDADMPMTQPLQNESDVSGVSESVIAAGVNDDGVLISDSDSAEDFR
jgi:hypothetical protein